MNPERKTPMENNKNNLTLELKSANLEETSGVETYLLGVTLDGKLSELLCMLYPAIPSWQFTQLGEPNEAITSDTHQEIIKRLEIVRAKVKEETP